MRISNAARSETHSHYQQASRIIAELTGEDSARRSREALARVGLAASATVSPDNCRAVSSNEWRLRVPSSRSRHCCSATSRPGAWIWPPVVSQAGVVDPR
jgi:hypothetical protein